MSMLPTEAKKSTPRRYKRKYGMGRMKTYAGKPAQTKEETRAKDRERARNNRKAKPEHYLNIALKSSRKKNLPAPTRDCPAVCELCGKPPDRRVLVLDHDHRTNAFRGWLCNSCNTALGRFGDGDHQKLLDAVMYIRRTSGYAKGDKEKEYPVATGFLDYFPLAVREVAHVSYLGNNKHNPNEPLHWDREKSQDEQESFLRHYLQRETVDTDGCRHSAKLAWRALAILQKEIEADMRKKSEKK